MLQKLLKIWCNHFHINFILYLLTIIFFSLGIAFGALGVKTLNFQDYQDLSSYFQNLISSLGNLDFNTINLAQQTVFIHLKVIFLIWFLGLTVIGVPIILIIMFIKGFVTGFTVGFIIHEKVYGGLLFALLAVLPSNIILIPVFIIGSVSALSFSLGLIKGKIKNGWGGISQFMISYCALMLLLAAVAVVGGLLEAYIIPPIVEIVISYY